MSSMWRKAMVYLGLGPDDEYDDYAAMPDDRPLPPPPVQQARTQQQSRPTGTVRARPPASAGPVLSTAPETGDVSAVRPVAAPPPGTRSAAMEDASKPRVRAVPRRQSVRPELVAPTSFNQAQDIADNFKAGKAVAMDLYDADRDLSRRLIDFSSGLCYGLGGNMEKVAASVYLIVPVGVEVSAEERAQLADRSDEDL
jgi:cell division inhibitor SepF